MRQQPARSVAGATASIDRMGFLTQCERGAQPTRPRYQQRRHVTDHHGDLLACKPIKSCGGRPRASMGHTILPSNCPRRRPRRGRPRSARPVTGQGRPVPACRPCAGPRRQGKSDLEFLIRDGALATRHPRLLSPRPRISWMTLRIGGTVCAMPGRPSRSARDDAAG